MFDSRLTTHLPSGRHATHVLTYILLKLQILPQFILKPLPYSPQLKLYFVSPSHFFLFTLHYLLFTVFRFTHHASHFTKISSKNALYLHQPNNQSLFNRKVKAIPGLEIKFSGIILISPAVLFLLIHKLTGDYNLR